MKQPKHLFILSREVMELADRDEIKSTIAGLKEMGLFRLPFGQEVYIRYDGSAVGADYPDGQVVAGPYDPDTMMASRYVYVSPRTGEELDLVKSHPAGESLLLLTRILHDILIVFLATRNAQKVTKENKLAKLGIGKSRNRFQFTTTISLPSELPDDAANPPKGGAVAPHLRRGHIRRQHYGKGNELEKKIWIEPVLVNADPDFVSSRRAYHILGS